MAFNDLEYHEVKKEAASFVESKRPPVHIRSKLDMIYSIDNQTVLIAGVRPAIMGKLGDILEEPYVKITYVRSKKTWNLYWMRGTLNWELYSAADTLTEALEMVRVDAHGCFFG